jgi:hypothetical protein
MQYFNTLPKIVQIDSNGIGRILVNLLARASIKSTLLENPLVFYQYDIQENDTPEIIAHKYYGDSYRYWIILFANKIMDPQWDWPMSGRIFNQYMETKYPDINYGSEVHHYEKILTQYDVLTNTTTVNIVVVDADTYNTTVENTKTFDLPTGQASVITTKQAVTIYEHESKLNEMHRTINILNSAYVDQFENELKTLMAA